VILTIALTWLTGRRAIASELRDTQIPVAEFAEGRPAVTEAPKGTVVLLSPDPSRVPLVRSHPWLDRLTGEKMLVLLTVTSEPRPYVPETQRVKVERISSNLVRVCASFGYMELPRITPILQACEAGGLEMDNDSTAFVYPDFFVVSKGPGGLPRWQRDLFRIMLRLSLTLATQLQIKPNRQVELGVEVAV